MLVTRAVTERLLIIAKTYPSPSSKYREVSCVAAVNDGGELRRLFPIPFRLLEQSSQFKKWDWITAKVMTPNDDKRPESRRIDIDSIQKVGHIDTGRKRDWAERLRVVEPHIIDNTDDLESRRLSTGQSLGFIRPSKLIGLEISKSDEPTWSEKDLVNLEKSGMFDSEDSRKRPLLEKLPLDFYFHYECKTSEGIKLCKHKIIDWEAGELYRTCLRDYGSRWEAKFRQRLEEDFSKKELVFMMGNMHRFPHQWLIVAFMYPPKITPSTSKWETPSLFETMQD